MDFITKLPLSNTVDSTLVVVDRFSRMEIFIIAYSTITAPHLSQIFINNAFSKLGLPVSIVSDRGSVFVSSFWTQCYQKIKIRQDDSTASCPETDRQTERVNQTLEQYLCMYVSCHKDFWHIWIPLAVFAYNNVENSLKKNHHFSLLMEEIPALIQLSFVKTHLLESYKQNLNKYRNLSRKN
ncbi:hypothetical protein O181_114237 [Austropuccinia psidii MF-1]|uniref:Integrase catalytic domain-containing protein n=1 Tax=Austropuccinia psidii MF-1 TaxID=1389203 RepID=A0A9Q3PW60_9BASI|nr:hypothetical protein [Austropuccinia psidii MF-1]